jgi:hypothetical protein
LVVDFTSTRSKAPPDARTRTPTRTRIVAGKGSLARSMSGTWPSSSNPRDGWRPDSPGVPHAPRPLVRVSRRRSRCGAALCVGGLDRIGPCTPRRRPAGADGDASCPGPAGGTLNRRRTTLRTTAHVSLLPTQADPKATRADSTTRGSPRWMSCRSTFTACP